MRRFSVMLFYVLASALSANCVVAQDKTTSATGTTSSAVPTLNFDDWGVGLALIRNSKKAISDASIVPTTGGLVRANQASTYEASLLLARHFYPFRSGRKKCGVPGSDAMFWRDCVGAMVGVGLGSSSANSQLINFVGVGLTMGGGIGNDPSSAWHFGFGVGRKFNVKTLGDGFVENAAPPAGETQVRYKTTDITAPFAYFTAHW
jgi:hypothetical protein